MGFSPVSAIDRLRTTVREDLVDALDEYDGTVTEDEVEERIGDDPEPVVRDRL